MWGQEQAKRKLYLPDYQESLELQRYSKIHQTENSFTSVKTVLIYGTKNGKCRTPKHQTFISNCLHKIFCIHWPEKISSEDLWRTGKQEPVASQIQRRKWDWSGDTLKKPASNINRQILKWNSEERGEDSGTNPSLFLDPLSETHYHYPS